MGLKSILKIEHFSGDCLKVIGEMTHQLSDFDKYQNAEILSLVKADLKLRPLPSFNAKRRPKATGVFLSNYHSGNDLTLSRVKKEKTAGDRLEVIYQMCAQLSELDGLKNHQILSLIKSYLKEHILEVDV